MDNATRGITTWTSLVVAPGGMVGAIKLLDTTVNVAAVPLKLTLVATMSTPRISPRA
jgi:hypothetical protein